MDILIFKKLTRSRRMQNFVLHNGAIYPAWGLSTWRDKIYRFGCKLVGLNPVEQCEYRGNRLPGHGQQVEIEKDGVNIEGTFINYRIGSRKRRALKYPYSRTSKLAGDNAFLQGVCEFKDSLVLVHADRGTKPIRVYSYKNKKAELIREIKFKRPFWPISEHEAEGVQVGADGYIYVGIVYTLPFDFKLNVVRRI